MPRCYMVKKGPRSDDPPCSPPGYRDESPIRADSPSDDLVIIEPESPAVNYEEIGSTPITERTAEETEAAHELLSLAHSLPPLPPVPPVPPLPPVTPVPALPQFPPLPSLPQLPQLPPLPSLPSLPSIPPLSSLSALPSVPLVSVLPPNEPVVPIYTYTIHPTNIYIIAEESRDPSYNNSVPTITPIPCGIEYTIEPQLSYLAYQHVPETVMPVGHILVPAAEVIPNNNRPEPSRVTDVVEPPSRLPCLMEPERPKIKPINAPRGKNAKYDCKECGKRYATSSNLSRHKQTHRSLDSVAAKRCEDCGKVYVSMPALAMHVLTHRMGHVCGICGKQFSRPWLLRGHLRSHTGEKPYDCPYEGCPKAFADRSNLRAHLQTHTGDKKFECSKCKKTFALKSYLAKHEETVCFRDEIACDPELIRPAIPETSGVQSDKPLDQPNTPSVGFEQAENSNQQNSPCLQAPLEGEVRTDSDCIQLENKEISDQTMYTDSQTEDIQAETAVRRYEPLRPIGIRSGLEPLALEFEDPPQPAVIRFDPSCVLPEPEIIRYDTMSLVPVFAE
ncbi:unnamed protein product [Danaus chrysippus]|uniref:(African queen) hypothetical protein n=1 Tax=Danaus chrysippus TaxID=151541 RepID=A0A8J2QBH6_9NEOP|nr:unnamed protein product [Danaus chrysippus]